MHAHSIAPSTDELLFLRALSYRFKSVAAALSEIARLRAVLTLPKGTVHVVSDVHGEHKKLRHVINNASGSLRPLVERVFGKQLSDSEKERLLGLLYYPREACDVHLDALRDDDERRFFLRETVLRGVALARALAPRYDQAHVARLFPEGHETIFRELLAAPAAERPQAFTDALLEPYLDAGRGVALLRMVARLVRNLSVFELVVAGDLGDRGPRLDRVVDYLTRLPNVSFTWGNHDASWMGACLGHPALVATVVRISLRYGRLSQLEEGYGIPVEPLEKLAREVYGDDPAERFAIKGADLRDTALLARMQKAIAIIQFKLEGKLAQRNPDLGLEGRTLLEHIDHTTHTVRIDQKTYPLLDHAFPTVDRTRPFELTGAEVACIDALCQSFVESQVLWQHMQFVARRGSMRLVRDDHVIFHGCIPVDDRGAFLPIVIDGREVSGRPLFDALERVVHRAFRRKATRDLDLLWYLWAGPRSPLFGKDRMATFETYLVADAATHAEHKNPYFKLIHDRDFCVRVARELGAERPERALIVNGHVPVKLEKGESPMKKSGMAVTIDGAFSEAYGDKGYTLVLDAERTYLAQHHHFDSVRSAIETGEDIIPRIDEIRRHEAPRTVGDTEIGASLRREIAALERLVSAYEQNLIEERVS